MEPLQVTDGALNGELDCNVPGPSSGENERTAFVLVSCAQVGRTTRATRSSVANLNSIQRYTARSSGWSRGSDDLIALGRDPELNDEARAET